MSRRRKKQAKAILSATGKKKPKPVATALIFSVVITLILGGIPFGLGKYIEFNSPGPYDSGAFVYSAQHLLQGAKLGIDEQSSARPGTLLANVIGVKLFGFNDIGPKAVQMVLQLGAMCFMFYALHKVFGSISAVAGTTVAAIYLSAPLIAKFGNVKEQFMIPFMIAAACCFLLYGFSQKRIWMILSGFFAVQPYYFKPTGLSILIALLVFIVLENALSKKWRKLALDLAIFTTGYIAGLGIPGSLYIWQNSFSSILKTLPVVMLEAGLTLGIIAFGIVAAIILIKKYRVSTQLSRVSNWIWIAGLCLLLIALLVSISMIKKEPGSENSDIVSYFQNLPVVSQLYFIIDNNISKLLRSTGLRGGYVSNSWKAIDMSSLISQIFRYYKALSVPILLALGSIITAVCVWILQLLRKIKNTPDDIQSKLVWMLGLWWLLDMAFVWGSPRSYEQYYLPLCGSGAMLGGFIIWKWQNQLSISVNKMPLLAVGMAIMVSLGCLSVPIFVGQQYSPDTGADYVKNYGHRRRGFGPVLKELPSRKQGAWVTVGEHVRTHSNEDDTMYVWGWMPGIYVQAQRLAPVSKAFESDMHVKSPSLLKREVDTIVKQMEKTPPKFIVDSRKRHFPNDRPPLELWPIVPPNTFGNEKPQFLKNHPREIAAFDTAWSKLLESQIEPEEGKRYEAMKPFRDFVMNNYRIARQYGNHILFEHIETPQKQAQ